MNYEVFTENGKYGIKDENNVVIPLGKYSYIVKNTSGFFTNASDTIFLKINDKLETIKFFQMKTSDNNWNIFIDKGKGEVEYYGNVGSSGYELYNIFPESKIVKGEQIVIIRNQFVCINSINYGYNLYDFINKKFIYKEKDIITNGLTEIANDKYKIYGITNSYGNISNFIIDDKLVFNENFYSTDIEETNIYNLIFYHGKNIVYDLSDNKIILESTGKIQEINFMGKIIYCVNETNNTKIYKTNLDSVKEEYDNPTVEIWLEGEMVLVGNDKRTFILYKNGESEFYWDFDKSFKFDGKTRYYHLISESKRLFFIGLKNDTGILFDSLNNKRLHENITLTSSYVMKNKFFIFYDKKTLQPIFVNKDDMSILSLNILEKESEKNYEKLFNFSDLQSIFSNSLLTFEEIKKYLQLTYSFYYTDAEIRKNKRGGYNNKDSMVYMYESIFENNLLTPEQEEEIRKIAAGRKLTIRKKIDYQYKNLINKYGKEKVYDLIFKNKKKFLESNFFDVWGK